LDGNAINAAKRRNRARNATFFVGDVTAATFPRTDYDAILFFSALHFITEEKRARLLAKAADCLKPDGVLTGSATLPLASLKALLSPRFEQVRLWTSDWGEGRVESYFECRQPYHGSSELRGDLSLTDENFAVAAPRGSGKNV
jgi:SAM-dependent methyltransferase